MGHLAGTDAESECAQRIVGRSVAVAAGDEEARLGQALFRADRMDDALAGVGHEPGDHVGDGRVFGGAACGRVMVDDAGGEARFGDFEAVFDEFRKRVVGAFVDQMAVGPEERGAVFRQDLVGRPELFEEGLACHSLASPMTGSQWRASSAPTRDRVISRRKRSGR